MKTSKTSQQWWDEVKRDPKKLARWLKAQYHGEKLAAERIGALANTQEAGPVATTLRVIANQEAKHANWVMSLLKARGIEPLKTKRDRYWSKTLPKAFLNEPLKKLAAIGAHAEKMRLERILTIATDFEAPEDIRTIFSWILQEEIYHEKSFRTIAGKRAMAQAKRNHREGMNALGLVA